MNDLAEILAAQVRTPVLRWSDGEQMSMAERLDLARSIQRDEADEWERSRWMMLSSGEMDMLSVACDFRTLVAGVDLANIDQGLRQEIGRAFTEYGGWLLTSPWHPVDAGDAAAEGLAMLADRRAQLAGGA